MVDDEDVYIYDRFSGFLIEKVDAKQFKQRIKNMSPGKYTLLFLERLYDVEIGEFGIIYPVKDKKLTYFERFKKWLKISRN